VYTAPATPPQPDSVTITVTPLADPSKQVQANMTIQSGASIIISPASATVVATGRITLTASQSGTSGSSFNWSVNGIAGGNTTFGRICVTARVPASRSAAGPRPQWIMWRQDRFLHRIHFS
jgi:hypothetical protein